MRGRARAVASLVGVLLLVALGALLDGRLDGGLGGGLGGRLDGDGGGTGVTERSDGPGSSGLPTVRRADLPREARATLRLIEDGGPFPYDRDGARFHNYEGLLPERADGHYREYTVVTPGEDDRGPRRIVAGGPREWYWTEDHYASFAEVLP